MNLNVRERLVKAFGENRVKWIKGIIAGFLIITIVNFGSPFTFWLIGTGLHEIWVTYILLIYNATVVLLVALVIFLLGKPIYVLAPEDPPEEDLGGN